MIVTVMMVALNFLRALYAFMAVLKWLKSCSPALVCPCATHGCCKSCGGIHQIRTKRRVSPLMICGCAFFLLDIVSGTVVEKVCGLIA